MITDQRTSALSLVLISAAAVLLGRAIQINNGFYNPEAMNWLIAALVAATAGVGLTRLRVAEGALSGTLKFVLLAGIGWQMEQLLTYRVAFYPDIAAKMLPLQAGVLAEAVLICAGFLELAPLRRWWFPLVLAVNAALGVWLLHISPHPYIDVITVHQEALKALFAHADPYRITFENIYDSPSTYYNPALVSAGRVLFGFPYPPLSLFMAAPGQFLAGDFRISGLAAIILAGGLIGYMGRRVEAALAACLLLTTPRWLFVLEQGWTEPFPLLLLALTVFFMLRRPLLGGIFGGLLLVAKQYMALGGLLLLRALFMPRGRRITALAMGAFAAAAVTLPLALWHPHAFYRSVVWLQTQEPFRGDSLSFLSWAALAGWGEGTFRWSIGAGAVAMIVCLVATRNTAGGFATSIAFSLLITFAFGSKAFCNYYYFVIGALCCGVAASAAEAFPNASTYTGSASTTGTTPGRPRITT